MAAYVKMIKKYDDDKKVIYLFGPDEKQLGEIEFDKKSKEFHILKQVNNLQISNEAYEKWASEQIIKIMYREKGKFPNVTSVEK